MKSALALFLALSYAGAASAAGAPPAFVPDLARGQAVAVVCQACHTSDASRGLPANPILQGQHPEYLVKQLAEFKAGTRQNAIMQGFAATLTDQDIRALAEYFSRQQPALWTPRPPRARVAR